jgi:DNA-binding CsgD family transcriptional regulator
MADLLKTVRGLYDTVVGAGGWSDSLSAILSSLDGSRSFLVQQDLLSGGVAVATDQGAEAADVDRYRAVSTAGLVPAWRLALPQGRVVRSSEMQANAVFARSAFYNEAIRPMGDFYGLVAQVARDHRRDCFVCLHRPKDAKDFSAKDVATLRRLTPHLAAALRIEERLGGLRMQAAGAQAALDRLEDGVLLLDAHAKPVFANRAAESLLAREPDLAAALARLAGPGRRELRQGGAFDIMREARQPLRLRVAPVGAAGEASWLAAYAVATAFVSDPEATTRQRGEIFAKTYSLTPAEARFAAEIAMGDGRAAAARRLKISPSTAQAHLSRIFEKTGTHRQAELVRLLLEPHPR